MSEQEKIDLIIGYLNQKLDRKKEAKVLLMLKNDSKFAELFKKASELHDFMEDIEDRRLLQQWSEQKKPSSMSEVEKKHLKTLFKQWDAQSQEKEPKPKIKRPILIGIGIFTLIFSILIFLNQSKNLELNAIADINNDDKASNKVNEELKDNNLKKGLKNHIRKDKKRKEKEGTIKIDNTQADTRIIEKKDIIEDNYHKNISLDKRIEAKLREVSDWEIKVKNIEIKENKVFVYFEYTQASLARKYTFEIENYKEDDVYKSQISRDMPELIITMNQWETGYYYWKLKTKGKVPKIGRFLKK